MFPADLHRAQEEGRLTLKVEHFAMVKDSEKAKW